MTVWIFQFASTGWKRKTLAWYNRFLAGEAKVIGADLKVAHVYMETESRQPSKLRLVEYEKHELNSDGHIDKVVEQNKMIDAVNLLPALDDEEKREGNVVDASQRFTRRRVEGRRWKPNPGQETLLMQKLSALDVPL